MSIETAADLKQGHYTLQDIEDLSNVASYFLDQARRKIFAPDALKKAPSYSLSQLAQICGTSKAAISKRVSNPGDKLPKGTLHGSSRQFTIEEVRRWAQHYGMLHRRAPGQRGKKIVIGNFKGGVSKTTTAANLAQGLSLKGYRVLLIDLDGQGSLTATFGISPELEVEVEHTIVPLTSGESDSLLGAIRPTYWSGVDIIPGCVALNNADFYLPARQARDAHFAFWDVLNQALDRDDLLLTYDYILIDTPPAISYLTINAFWCADALLVPMPPEGPDFASSVQFWNLFGQLAGGIEQRVLLEHGARKVYDWIRILPTKVDHQRAHTPVVLGWMKSAYRDFVMNVEIPVTSAVSVSGVQMGTIYDISRYVGSAKTYLRARDAYDRLVNEVDALTRMYCWEQQARIPM